MSSSSEEVKEILGMVGKDIVVEVRKVLHFGSLNNMMKNMFVKSYVFGEG